MNTNNFLMGPSKRRLLAAKIKGLVEESKRTRKLIQKSKKESLVIYYNNIKFLLNEDIRYHLLAYAFLCGKKYSTVENFSKEKYKWKPVPSTILEIVLYHAQTIDKSDINLELIKEWMKK